MSEKATSDEASSKSSKSCLMTEHDSEKQINIMFIDFGRDRVSEVVIYMEGQRDRIYFQDGRIKGSIQVGASLLGLREPPVVRLRIL